MHWTAACPACHAPLYLSLSDFTLYCFLLLFDLTFFLCSPFAFLFFSPLLADFLYKSLSWQCNANWKGSLMAKLIIDGCRHAPLQLPLPYHYLMLRPLLVFFVFLLWSSCSLLFVADDCSCFCMHVCASVCVCDCVCNEIIYHDNSETTCRFIQSQLSSNFRFKIRSSLPQSCATRLDE